MSSYAKTTGQHAMELPEILTKLTTFTGSFPREALKAAVEKREEITPELLRVLEEACEWELDYDADKKDADSKSMSCLYALFLLAQFRETRAYPLVIKLAHLPEKKLDDLIGMTMTEDLDRILASVCGGDTSLIEDLIEDPGPYEYVRSAGVAALQLLVATGDKPRDEVMAYYKKLFNGRLERSCSHVWNKLVFCSTRLHPGEVYDEIVAAYEEGLAESGYMSLKDVDKVRAMSREKVLGSLATATLGYIEDTVKEMRSWACFNENKKQPPTTTFAPAALTPQKTKQKVGPNDPCPCRSGRKYKKCCGRNS
jgi:hypothetical protein